MLLPESVIFSFERCSATARSPSRAFRHEYSVHVMFYIICHPLGLTFTSE